jgi:hypothetical protein
MAYSLVLVYSVARGHHHAMRQHMNNKTKILEWRTYFRRVEKGQNQLFCRNLRAYSVLYHMYRYVASVSELVSLSLLVMGLA